MLVMKNIFNVNFFQSIVPSQANDIHSEVGLLSFAYRASYVQIHDTSRFFLDGAVVLLRDFV